jgi:hypothetical protein
MPEISSAATARTSRRAGTFTSPPSPGGRLIDSLIVIPYSRIRSHPMIQASTSPIVA